MEKLFDIRYSNGEVRSIFEIRDSNGDVGSIFDTLTAAVDHLIVYGSRFSWGTLMYKNLKFVRRHHGASYPAKQRPLARYLYVDGWPNTD